MAPKLKGAAYEELGRRLVEMRRKVQQGGDNYMDQYFAARDGLPIPRQEDFKAQLANLEREYQIASQGRSPASAILAEEQKQQQASLAEEQKQQQAEQEWKRKVEEARCAERRKRWEANPMRPDWAKIVLDNPKIRSSICNQQFQNFDVDGSGELDEVEIKDLCENVCDQMSIQIPGTDKMHQAFEKFDRNKSRGLDREEFAKFFGFFLKVTLQQYEDGLPK